MPTESHQRDLAPSHSIARRGPVRWIVLGEPQTYRGPFARWPRTADGALAALVFAVSVVAVAASALGDGQDFTIDVIRDRPFGAFAMLVLAAVALLWRRKRPIAVTLCVMAIMVVWAVAGHGDGQDLALIVAIYSVGRYTDDDRLSLAALVAVIAVSMLGTVIDSNQRVDILPALLSGGLPWYVGRRIRNRGEYLALLTERAERLEADQLSRERQAVADERSRIARELHDVVAHQVSMMTVQAGAAKTVARDDIDAAVDAMGDVERAGREALGELRHLLGVLRPDDQTGSTLGPQPGFGDIRSLADHLTDTGADVSLAIASPPMSLPAAVELSAYRIVQESLTNIIKHAGPNPAVRIDVGFDGLGLVITIINTITIEETAGLPGSGYGISGMRERVTLLGGTLTAVARPPGFHLEARIPLEQERT